MDYTKYNYFGELPKPNLNTKWYEGDDKYSDGPVEDQIIDIIANHEDGDYAKEIGENYCWATFYHLSDTRQNILNWYPFKKDASVLEIGCGMGAITELLCKRCRSVTAVEMSLNRAVATTLRCREYENLEVIVANLNDIEFREKYDYITLIGVLEYQGTYTDTDSPYVDFLKKIRSLLKDDGKLLVAIENKYGLKYWCGAREDHSGIPFDGLNQYRLSDAGFRTFARNELKEMLKVSGFEYSFFYYPIPDYKLPARIFSEDMLPQKEDMYNYMPYYVPNDKTMCVLETPIYDDIIDNKAFEFMANSFFVECSAHNVELGVIKKVFTSAPNSRKQEHHVLTLFTKDVVKKIGMFDNFLHIEKCANNLIEMKENGLKTLPFELHGNEIITPFCKLPISTEVFIRAYENRDLNQIYVLFDKLLLDIKNSSTKVSESFLQEMGILQDNNLPEDDVILKNGYIDMIYRNAFWDNGDFVWFDQEWMLENIPASFILYHNVVEIYQSYPWMEEVLSLDSLLRKYKISEITKEYDFIWGSFLNVILDDFRVNCERKIYGVHAENVVNNIKKIMQ